MPESKDEEKHFLDRDYWLARLTELKDSVMRGEIKAKKYDSEVKKLRVRARQAGVEL